jgi:selenocysteine-specific translation elongation factor
MYPEFQYFLEAYCTLSLETEEILESIQQFKENETYEMQEALQRELNGILMNRKIREANQMIEEYGNRLLSADQAEKWIKQLLKELKNKKA